MDDGSSRDLNADWTNPGGQGFKLLRSNAYFRHLWSARAVSVAGDSLGGVALILRHSSRRRHYRSFGPATHGRPGIGSGPHHGRNCPLPAFTSDRSCFCWSPLSVPYCRRFFNRPRVGQSLELLTISSSSRRTPSWERVPTDWIQPVRW